MPLDELLPQSAVDFSFAKPAEGKDEPLFWIREIRFLSKFSTAPDDEIRRVEFKKGLNIVWAEAPAHSNPDDVQRISGHATGKTTLCRMIRYLLGENHIASKNVADGIFQKFPDGYVIGCFVVKGEPWCVARAFMKLHDDFALRTDSLEALLGSEEQDRCSYKIFEEKLTALLPEITPLTSLVNKEELTFKHLLPWLTRDQDSQYTKLTEWRDNSLSDSGSPVLAQKQTMLLMRSVLDPRVADEAELIQKQADLAKQLQDFKNLLNSLQMIIDRDEERVKEFDEYRSQASELGEMFLPRAIKENEDLLSTTSLNLEDEGKLAKLQKKRDELYSQYEGKASIYNQAVQAYKQHKRELNELEKSVYADEYQEEHIDEIQLAAQIHPSRKYCCVPLEIAQKECCQLSLRYATSKDQESHDNLSHGLSSELFKKKNIVQGFSSFLHNEKRDLDLLKNQLEHAENELADFKKDINLKRNSRAAKIGTVLEALRRYKCDLQKQTNLQKDYKTVSEQHKTCSEALAALREDEKRAAYGIMKIYDDTIRFMLGSDIIGSISFSGGEIELKCSYNNSSLSSAALNAVKNVCFDLAALASSIGGRGSHPRFLIHDGPRVSDLSATIFEQYFLYARELEKMAEGKTNFQYIITTTEPPPEGLQKFPWLVCKLDAALPETRLLKCDL